ncbi:MAG: hypothetical protein KAT74_10255 [Candidatus Cloacimonetes bacterium]|nr:hypothetical protein [Candidatus Cloacimonadota bacterium]
MISPKGIFCLEGLWYNDLRKKSTVKPILELLELNSKIPFIHEDCATIVETIFYLKKWTQKRYTKYPILYLAFHGAENGILIDNRLFSLDELGNVLEAKCKNKIIVLASCSTVNTNKRNLKKFLSKTGALAICGYKLVVPWITSTAFELMMLAAMQDNIFDGRGVLSIYEKINKIANNFKDLDFRMVTRKELV